MHATKPNEIIHFDYLDMGKSVDDAEYVLTVNEDFSNYVWLKQCEHADSDSIRTYRLVRRLWRCSTIGLRPRQSLQEPIYD
jgi:hypothetical protein